MMKLVTVTEGPDLVDRAWKATQGVFPEYNATGMP